MKKEAISLILGMFLMSLVFASAQEWVSTTVEFVNSDEEGNLPEGYNPSSIQGELMGDSANNVYIFYLILLILAVILITLYFRKINKAKLSKKSMVKKK